MPARTFLVCIVGANLKPVSGSRCWLVFLALVKEGAKHAKLVYQRSRGKSR